jgi:cyclopropane-fatty-acyl-phospholipid synthase
VVRPPLHARAIVLQKTLHRIIRHGRLTVIEPDGTKTQFGQVPIGAPQLDVIVRLKGILTPSKIAINPGLYLGECYTDGALVIEKGTLWDLLDICGRNLPPKSTTGKNWLVTAGKAILRRLLQRNSLHGSRRNVTHHYDLSNRLYENFLDPDLQYSCAYFSDHRLSLTEAQDAKKQHIAAKLLLKPGQRILDIGCGWGGLALSLARLEDVHVLGVTLSPAQLAVAQRRARQAGLEQRVKFALLDFREIAGRFDRIVSVGMFEHVGTPHYSEFFRIVSRLLKDDGVALIHSIGRKDGPDVTSSWIRKYIFPGGYIPALSEVLSPIERAGLWLSDLEILRLHYAQTLRYWREAFLANREKLGEIYDERFCRMWEFYLAISEMSFRFGGLMVFQAQLARRIDAVPLTRDYMFERERHAYETWSADKRIALSKRN